MPCLQKYCLLRILRRKSFYDFKLAELTSPTVLITEGGYFKVTVSTCLFLVKSYSLYPITCSLTSSWTIPTIKINTIICIRRNEKVDNTFCHQVHVVLEPKNKDLITGMKRYLSANRLITGGSRCWDGDSEHLPQMYACSQSHSRGHLIQYLYFGLHIHL